MATYSKGAGKKVEEVMHEKKQGMSFTHNIFFVLSCCATIELSLRRTLQRSYPAGQIDETSLADSSFN